MGSVPVRRRRRASVRRRHPWVRWTFAASLAVASGTWSAWVVNRADDARAAYGTLLEVPVIVRDLAPGAVVGESDIVVRALPGVAVPDDVAGDAVGRTVREGLVAGEVVLESRLGGRAAGPAALLGPGRRAVAVPRPERGLAVGVGDILDLLAPADGTEGASAGARRVARSAVVIAVDENVVTVAVSVAETPAVARAVLDGSVAVALVGEVP